MTKQEKTALGMLGEEWAKKLGYFPDKPSRYIQLLRILRELNGFAFVVNPLERGVGEIPDIEVKGPNDFALSVWAEPEVGGQAGQLADIARLLYFYLIVSQEGKVPLLRQNWGVAHDQHTYACEQFAAGFLVPERLVPETFPNGKLAGSDWQSSEAGRAAGIGTKYAEMRVGQLSP